ncbi:MAG: Cys-tRNA(Pro) deacylase [Firmicutes bacterium]|nr:Cys-tRNA(Pro) deacylase [Bacillota bacterium]
MAKEVKTNAMRILDKNKVSYRINTYECEEFHDGVSIAQMLGQSPNMTFKTLVTQGKSKNFFVFVIPVNREIDLKAAAASVGEKSVEMIHVKDINKITGYIRGGCTPIGMKKQFVTVVDNTAKNFDEIIISGGRIGSQIFLAPDDLVKVTGAKYDDILA